MRTWYYEIDPSRREWILWVYDGDLKTGVLNARYNHRAKPGIEEYARFIADACNAAEASAFDHKTGRILSAAMKERNRRDERGRIVVD